jgi:hypothetical protein
MIKLNKNYMKKIIISSVIALTNILTSQILQAQGTITYLSNLGQSFTKSNPVGSDSWLAVDFMTGNNTTGYLFDSIDLGMANAIDNPSSFAVMLYSSVSDVGIHPGNNLGILEGSDNPSTAGIYNYTSSANLMLSPNTRYFIVLTAAATTANGAYEWNYANTQSYNPSDGWSGFAVTVASSNGGASWTRLGTNPDYDYSEIAISATPVPEPGVLSLLGLGGAALLWRRQAKTAR